MSTPKPRQTRAVRKAVLKGDKTRFYQRSHYVDIDFSWADVLDFKPSKDLIAQGMKTQTQHNLDLVNSLSVQIDDLHRVFPVAAMKLAWTESGYTSLSEIARHLPLCIVEVLAIAAITLSDLPREYKQAIRGTLSI